MRFNPFRTDELKNLSGADLAILREIPEGWYIEYKSEVSRPEIIARSISSFANHYGGWLFYGVGETAPGDSRAGSFAGVSGNDLPSLLMRIRDAARMLISPTPPFETHVVKGPCQEIGLPTDRAIVVVRTELGLGSPYVHSSGRIYRRVADASDPKAETDRAVFDLLWKRGDEARKGVRKLLARELELSKAENDASFAQFFFLSDPLGEHGARTKLTFSDFASIVQEARGELGDVRFDNVFLTADGIMARSVYDNDRMRQLLTWEHFGNGTSILTVPFARVNADALGQYKYPGVLADNLEPHEFDKVLDLNIAFLIALGAVRLHWLLSQRGGVRGPFFVKIKLHGVWRRVPFFDTAAFTHFVKEHGLPVIQRDAAEIPPGSQFVKLADGVEAHEGGLIAAAVDVFGALLQALGVPAHVVADSGNELLEAATRAPGVRVATT